jgi:hypothetical protein
MQKKKWTKKESKELKLLMYTMNNQQLADHFGVTTNQVSSRVHYIGGRKENVKKKPINSLNSYPIGIPFKPQSGNEENKYSKYILISEPTGYARYEDLDTAISEQKVFGGTIYGANEIDKDSYIVSSVSTTIPQSVLDKIEKIAIVKGISIEDYIATLLKEV